MAITGVNFVRFTRHGLQSIRIYWSRTRDRFEVRRQGLKLRFWDERHQHPPSRLFDHTYESIKSLSGMGIYEMRLDDEIGGHANIRVILFDPPSGWEPEAAEKRPLKTIWILEVLPKRRNEWTTNDITRFRASRLMIGKRFYGR